MTTSTRRRQSADGASGETFSNCCWSPATAAVVAPSRTVLGVETRRRKRRTEATAKSPAGNERVVAGIVGGDRQRAGDADRRSRRWSAPGARRPAPSDRRRLPRGAAVALALVQLAANVAGQQQPTISHISRTKTVSVGDTVDLDCSVQYAYNFPVLWVKLDEADSTRFDFISSGSSLIVPDQRFSIRHDSTTSSFTLQITKLQETDGGIYQCRVILSQTSVLTKDVRLFVRVPPVIADNSTRSIVTSTGANATLECYARGQPRPRITWRRQNNNLLPTGGPVYRGNVLHIFNVTKDDRGTYYCIADNQVGRGARRNIGVEVEFSPVVKADQQEYNQASGYPAEMACHVEAYPMPQIVWLKDGYQLNTNQHFKIDISGNGHDFTDTVLRVRAIEPSQYGNYSCRAINKLGSAEQVIVLRKSYIVVCPPACDPQFLSAAPVSSSFYRRIQLLAALALIGTLQSTFSFS